MIGYLVSTDGYRDSILIHKVATTKDAVLQIMNEWLKEYRYKANAETIRFSDDMSTLSFDYVEDYEEHSNVDYKAEWHLFQVEIN